jgi:hypothetical protein
MMELSIGGLQIDSECNGHAMRQILNRPGGNDADYSISLLGAGW